MHADVLQFSYNRPDENCQEIYRKRDDGDHEVPSTTTDHCRRIRRRSSGSAGDRLRRNAHTRSHPARRRSSSTRRSPAATPLAQCPAGEEPDLYTSLCVPHLVPNAGTPYSVIGGNPDLAAVNIPGGGGAIPCTGHNSGQCIGLSEEAASEGPAAVPRSTVGSSPTVTGSEGTIGG